DPAALVVLMLDSFGGAAGVDNDGDVSELRGPELFEAWPKESSGLEAREDLSRVEAASNLARAKLHGVTMCVWRCRVKRSLTRRARGARAGPRQLSGPRVTGLFLGTSGLPSIVSRYSAARASRISETGVVSVTKPMISTSWK